jgi:cell wall assembly regulator SMI1
MAEFDAARFNKAWARYTAKATQAHAPFMTYLASGASSDDIKTAEEAVGCEFPPDLRYFLGLHNGSNEYQVLPGWELFATDRIVDEWKIWEELYRTQFKPDNTNCAPNGPIKADEWWRLRWVPFTGDGGGDHLCVDMDPAAGGAHGQVITMWHDAANRDCVAPSLTDYIEMIADDFEADEITWDEEWGGVHNTPDKT